MIVSYRGHRVDVHRAKCLAGYSLVYYNVFRESDMYECESGFSDSADTVRTWIRLLKERVNAELASDDPWGERKQKELDS